MVKRVPHRRRGLDWRLDRCRSGCSMRWQKPACRCVETRHMRAVLNAQIHKTDRDDTRGIAQMMRSLSPGPCEDAAQSEAADARLPPDEHADLVSGSRHAWDSIPPSW
jgi:hypothetical protein